MNYDPNQQSRYDINTVRALYPNLIDPTQIPRYENDTEVPPQYLLDNRQSLEEKRAIDSEQNNKKLVQDFLQFKKDLNEANTTKDIVINIVLNIKVNHV